MSIAQITTEALALSTAQRVSLAQTLWESLETDPVGLEDDATADEAIRRDAEMSAGVVVGRSHDEVMQTARHAVSLA